MAENKKLFAVFGNCQAKAIGNAMLACSEFDSDFERVLLPGVHELLAGEYRAFLDKCHMLDLFIFQNVQKGEYQTRPILDRLSKSCRVISMPSIFFNAYNPEVAYLRKSGGALFYHDRNMLQRIDDPARLRREVFSDPDYFPKSFSQKCLELSIDSLVQREKRQSTDIIISDYICANFRAERLFHVLNHPTRRMIEVVASRVLQLLGLDRAVVDPGFDIAPLDACQFPVYLSHYLNLGMDFDNQPCYRISGCDMGFDEFLTLRRVQYERMLGGGVDVDPFEFSVPTMAVGGDELKFR